MYKDLEELIKTEKLGKVSKEEAFKMGTNMLLKKCMENADNMDVEELRKNWRKGVANLVGILGLTHATHYMAQPGVEQLSERQKSPTYQRVQQKIDAKAANRNPSNNLSVEDQVKQARKQGRAEGQAIIDKNYENSRDQKIDNFLNTISMIESSGGKNTEHKLITSGSQKGTRAFGNYGLMPRTVHDLANRMKRDAPDNPYSNYSKMTHQQISQSLKENPDHQHVFGKYMANHLYDKFNGDENKMAYSWIMGHNIDPSDFEQGKRHSNFKDFYYTKRYNKYKPKKESEQKPVQFKSSVTSNNPM